MKKKTLIPLTVAAVAALFAGNVNAKTLSPQEVLNEFGTTGSYENDVFIIGGYVFKDSFTLEEVFLGGASAAPGSAPMIYHYDVFDAKWKNSMKDEADITVPTSFDLDKARLSASEGSQIIDLTDTERIAELEALEEEASKFEESEYTAESWEVLQEALKIKNDTTTASLKNKIDALTSAINGLKFVNAVDLEAIKAARAALVASDYVAESKDLKEMDTVTYNEFVQSYDSLDNSLPEDTYEAIDAKIKKLSDCINKLEKVSTTDAKTALGESITAAEKKEPTDYTTATKTAFENALANADAINKDSKSTVSQINAAKAALDAAMKALVFVNRETLDTRVAEAKTLVADETYTILSRDTLSTKITAVENADKTPETITKAIIAGLIDGLDEEISHLVTVECENALNELIKDGDSYVDKVANGEKYDNTLYTKFTTALGNATAVTKKVETEYIIKDTDKEQADYESLIDKLDTAIQNLKFLKEAAFEELYEEATNLVGTDYTDEAWDVFTYALEKVKTEGFVSNQEVVDNFDNLTKYLTTLKANKVELDAKVVAEFNKVLTAQTDNPLTESEYTEETWANYAKALTAAQTYESTGEKTNSSYVSHTEALTTACEALRFKKDALVEKLEEVNEEVNTDTYTTYYTKETRDALSVAIESANLVMNDENPSKEEIAKATKDLDDKLKALEVNPEILTNLLKEVYAEDDYSVNSYAAYKTAKTAGESASTSEEKIAAIKAIDAAKKLLVKKTTEEALSNALLKADADYGKYDDSTFADKYTGDSKAAYVALREEIDNTLVTFVPAALDVPDHYTVNATSETVPVDEAIVQKAITDLGLALDKLVPSNMVSLNTMKEAANEAISDKSLYTAASINRVKEKLNMAEKTNSEVAAKIDAIRIAINASDAANTESTGLVFSNAEALKTATEKAKLNEAEYDLTDVKSALAMEQSTYALVAKKIVAINSAVAAAYKNPKNLAELNDFAKLNDTKKYTEESWTKFYAEYTKIRNNGTEDSFTLVADKIASVEGKLSLLVSVSKKKLADLVTAEADRDLDGYSDTTKTAYNAALEAATKYLENKTDASEPGINGVQDNELTDAQIKSLDDLYKDLQKKISELAA